ncbi:hypothetical protein DACRYDRAFT_32643, partial [Dacryopinax primogenitus]
YNIKHIHISGYNSHANGIVEQSHCTVRESLVCLSGTEVIKWPILAPVVFWAERITIHSIASLSPYYMAHGTHPLMPLNIAECTFLSPPTETTLSTAELL